MNELNFIKNVWWLTDYNNKNKEEKTKEIIILIFPDSRKDKE